MIIIKPYVEITVSLILQNPERIKKKNFELVNLKPKNSPDQRMLTN